MPRIPADLVVDLGRIRADTLLRHWRWLMNEWPRPIFATALGDLFLRSPITGGLFWFDVGRCQVSSRAKDTGVFDPLSANFESSVIASWFRPKLVGALRAKGMVLGPRQCYTYWKHPLLGGNYAPSNFRIVDLRAHFRIWGPKLRAFHEAHPCQD